MLDRWFEPVVWAWMGLATVPCLLLVFIDAPYGRHARPGWGPTLPSRIGWILMESPSVIGMALLFFWGGHFGPLKSLYNPGNRSQNLSGVHAETPSQIGS